MKPIERIRTLRPGDGFFTTDYTYVNSARGFNSRREGRPKIRARKLTKNDTHGYFIYIPEKTND